MQYKLHHNGKLGIVFDTRLSFEEYPETVLCKINKTTRSYP